MSDIVNSPKHYTYGGIETIDFMKAKLNHLEYVGYLKGNVLKYISRAGMKEATAIKVDLMKAQWYLNKLIEEVE